MIAAARGGGVETTIPDEDPLEAPVEGTTMLPGEGSDSMIAGLLLQGASLSAQTDKTG